MTLCSQFAKNILFTGFATRALLSFDYPLFHGRLSFIVRSHKYSLCTPCGIYVAVLLSLAKQGGRIAHPGRQSLYNGNSFI